MQFQVPQFETENTIVGPLTLVQFIYVGATALICFLLFSVLELWVWVITSSILVGIALTFALAKVNGRPMTIFSVAVFNYFWQPKVLVYREPSAVPVGLKNIKPETGKKLEVQARPQLPEERVSIPVAPVITSAPVSIPAAPVIIPTPTPVPTQLPVKPPVYVQAPAVAPEIKTAPFTVPITPEIPAAKPVTVQPKGQQSLLQGLFNRITVSSSPIPQRELSLKKELLAAKQRYAVVESAGGETEVVRRVDYK